MNTKIYSITILVFITCLCISCNVRHPEQGKKDRQLASSATAHEVGTFGYDYQFLKDHREVILLEKDNAKVLIVPSLQGRVMTSSANGIDGQSYGWINYELLASGKYEAHINAFGGEERLWLGPEGGQFGLFFPKGAAFKYENWQTPGVLDTAAFTIANKSSDKVSFIRKIDIENYSGTKFSITLRRTVSVLSRDAISLKLNTDIPDNLKTVGYESVNSIENTGSIAWNKCTGVLSLWLLSMLKASDRNTIIIPYKDRKTEHINDRYFGKVPDNRLKKKNGVALFKADALFRSKIGFPPQIVTGLAGSYDARNNILTVIQYDYKEQGDYVNSMWEQQEHPYKGDVFNAYNDGPNETGKQLGAFYEMESSSPAIPLLAGQSQSHTQRIYHFEGEKEILNKLSLQIFGTDLGSL